MNEQHDIPRLDGLRPDDPPFRENFSTQPDKTPDQLQAQRAEHNARRRSVRNIPPKGPAPILTPKETDTTSMHDTQDVIAIIRRLAGSGKFVHVEKLIEALK